MGNRQQKTDKIIETTINILGKEGATALSMRKVSESAGISLSNLQYYYKTREDLIIATVQFYFKQCQEEVSREWEGFNPNEPHTATLFLKKILSDLLVDGNHHSHCTMFREIWALSSRDPHLAEEMKSYYQQYAEWLVDLLASFSDKPKDIVALLLPYVEGYSIMGSALPLDKNEVVDLLVKLILIN